MSKICIACGMPMEQKDHFAMGDESKDYCLYCARADGSMQSYQEKLESFTNLLVKKEEMDESSAKLKAESLMANLPAWKESRD